MTLSDLEGGTREEVRVSRDRTSHPKRAESRVPKIFGTPSTDAHTVRPTATKFGMVKWGTSAPKISWDPLQVRKHV